MLSEAIQLTLFPAMMAFAASSDLLTMTIANRVSLDSDRRLRCCLPLLSGMSGAEMLSHARRGRGGAGGRVCLLCLRLDRRRRRQARRRDGAVARISAILFDYLVYASLLGGALTLLIVQFRTHAAAAHCCVGREWAERLHRQGGGVPYGIALAAAALLVYPQTEWMAALGL